MTPTEQVTLCNRDETQVEEKTSVKAGGKETDNLCNQLCGAGINQRIEIQSEAE